MSEPVGFRDFVAARSAALLRSAWLLTGDKATARDLVQAALVKTQRRWPWLARRDAPEVYVRRVMVSMFLAWERRPWRGAFPVAVASARPGPGDAAAGAGIPLAVSQALQTLPPRQRAVVVLRFFDDLTEAQAADVLCCSVAAVRSQTARALSRLHECPQLHGLF